MGEDDRGAGADGDAADATGGPIDTRGTPERGVDLSGPLLEAWRRSGGWWGLVAASTPTAVFVLVSVLVGLLPAVIAAAVAAGVVFAVQLLRKEPLGGAVAGLVVVIVCAVAAAVTGDDRGFFLLPTATPAVLALVCVGTVVARRPLTGLVFNRLAGGPRAWRDHAGLLRFYDVTTVVGAVLSAANFGVRAFFFATHQTALLAAVYTAGGPAVIVFGAITVMVVRRRLRRERRAPRRDSASPRRGGDGSRRSR